jgi:glycosyltransferase involved in cell wall biosynthesis
VTNITGLVLTRDERPNIARTLAKLTWLQEIVVVDSHSTDGTPEIAAGFSNVRVVERRFTTHAEQWNFGLEETGINTEWVLALDADFVLSDALVREIQSLDPDQSTAGYRAAFKYCIDGQPLRGAAYPPVSILYRRTRGRYQQDGHTQRIRLNGEVRGLEAPVMHDDRKSLTDWLASQARYMALEAEKLSDPAATIGIVDHVRRWLVIAPPAMFFYCYIVRGGIVDGKAGLCYALQRSVSEGILSLFLVRRMLGRAG